MSSVHQFKAALKGGGARGNRFEIILNIPGASSDVINNTRFLVSSSQIPGSTLGTIEQPFRGRFLKLAGDRTFESWDCTFVNDTDFGIREALEKWSNQINAYNANTGSHVPDDYMSDAFVYQLDSYGNRIKEFRLMLAWPSVVAPIELAQDANNQIEQFSVTFEYSDIEMNATKGQSSTNR